MFEEWNLSVNKSTVVLARSSAVDCTTFEPHTSLFPLVSEALLSPIRSHVMCQLCVNQPSLPCPADTDTLQQKISFAELLGIRLSCLAIRSWPVRIEGSIVGT